MGDGYKEDENMLEREKVEEEKPQKEIAEKEVRIIEIKKVDFLTSFLIAIALMGVLLMIGMWCLRINNYQLFLYKRGDTTDFAETGQIDDEETIREKLEAIDQVIQSSYLFDYQKQDLIDGLYKGYVAGLQDAYTTYYTAEEYEELQETTSGKYYGIGVKVQKETSSSYVVINSVFEDSPAQKAGIEAGDQILKIDNETTENMTLEEVVSAIKSTEEGKQITLALCKSKTNETVEVTLALADVEVDTVSYEMLDNQIGYVKLVQFEEVSYEQFKNAVETLKKQGMQSMILDLRDNPGGILSVVVDIADYLLPEGLIVYTEDKDGNRKEYTSDDEKQFTMPLVVLINGSSASASEILAGAVKDYGTGTLIGTNTFGKGIVQNVLSLGDGSALKITTSNYYTPKGNYIHKVGIAPDIEVEQAETADTDEQLKAAIQELTK